MENDRVGFFSASWLVVGLGKRSSASISTEVSRVLLSLLLISHKARPAGIPKQPALSHHPGDMIGGRLVHMRWATRWDTAELTMCRVLSPGTSSLRSLDDHDMHTFANVYG